MILVKLVLWSFCFSERGDDSQKGQRTTSAVILNGVVRKSAPGPRAQQPVQRPTLETNPCASSPCCGRGPSAVRTAGAAMESPPPWSPPAFTRDSTSPLQGESVWRDIPPGAALRLPRAGSPPLRWAMVIAVQISTRVTEAAFLGEWLALPLFAPLVPLCGHESLRPPA